MTYQSTDRLADLSRIRRHLISWGTGTPVPGAPDGASTIVVEDPAHLGAVVDSGVAGAETLILVPGDDSSSDPRVVGYSGSCTEPGGELAVGEDFYLQIQDYAAAGFMALLGPTLVTVTGPDDFGLFLADADHARVEGRFPDFAVAGPVRLANLPALGAPVGTDGPALRLHVDAVARLSTSPTGSALGTVGAGPAELRRAWRRRNEAGAVPCAVCLGGVLDEPRRSDELAARPWLPRYLAALDALRALNAGGVAGLRVVGFGAGLLPGRDHHTVADASDALLLFNEEAAFVREIGTGRTFGLSLRAARYAEALLTRGSVDAASEIADPDGLRTVRAFFDRAGVRLGTGAGV
jgi:hypothetical protein